MGSFNPQYERYYKNLKGNSSINNRISRNDGFNSVFKGNYFVKRIMRDLIGVAFLFVFILICKIIVIPQTQTAYNYSKKIVSTNFDYKAAINKVEQINLSEVKAKATDFLEKIKADNSLN